MRPGQALGALRQRSDERASRAGVVSGQSREARQIETQCCGSWPCERYRLHLLDTTTRQVVRACSVSLRPADLNPSGPQRDLVMCSASHRKADCQRSQAAGIAAAFVLFVSSISPAQAVFVVEHGGLQIRFPENARQEHSSGFDMYLANFGAPKYGGELRYPESPKPALLQDLLLTSSLASFALQRQTCIC